jgi:gamma-glutamyltranspeptidase/glutathione hydrolase
MDAAIATAFAQGVIDPPMGGIGGFGGLLHCDADGRVSALDYLARAGGRSRPDQWAHLQRRPMADRFGYGLPGLVNDVGYQSVAVPGVVDGLGVAHERWGRRPWAELLTPAIRLAYVGFLVTKSTREWWDDPGEPGRAAGDERMTITAAAAAQFAPDGMLLAVGERCRLPDQGRTIDNLADRGHR